MTTENKVEMARAALDGSLIPFVSVGQREFLKLTLNGEEAEGMAEIVIRLDERIKTMPKTYETDGQGKDAVVYLHYFLGSYDGWITEKDQGDGTADLSQYQAYGFASFSGKENGEFGYIGIQEIIDNQVEIDLYWTPKKVKDI